MADGNASEFSFATLTQPQNQLQITPLFPHSHPISLKLSDDNFLMWRQQVLATIRGYGLEPFLDGSVSVPSQFVTADATSTSVQPNPAFLAWHRQDQLLSSWLLASLSESSMVLVVGLTTSKDIWNALSTRYASQSKAKVMQYKLLLQTFKKNSLPMCDYLGKIKSYCDFLGSAGCRILDEDQILHILSGLGPEYDPVMVTISSSADRWTVPDVAALLLSFETRLESSHNPPINVDGSQPAANFVHSTDQRRDVSTRGGRGFSNRGGPFRGRGGRSGRGGKLVCQLCQKPGHSADRCWHRFDQSYGQAPPLRSLTPAHPQPTANFAQGRGLLPSPSVQPQLEFNFDVTSSSSWYPDSGATHHVSNDLTNLNSGSEYVGGKSL